METKDILRKIREDNNLTQDQMAEKIMVTRQAVSRWELGETQPNTDTLKILSNLLFPSIYLGIISLSPARPPDIEINATLSPSFNFDGMISFFILPPLLIPICFSDNISIASPRLETSIPRTPQNVQEETFRQTGIVSL